MDAESCTLAWKPPADDGGNEIINYIVEKKEVGTDKYKRKKPQKLLNLLIIIFRWVKVAPHCLENSCPVRGLEEGKEYEFRVIAENLHGLSEPLTLTEGPVTAKWPFSKRKL